MQGVHVSIKSVQECLSWQQLIFNYKVRLSLGDLGILVLNGAFMLEPSLASDDEGCGALGIDFLGCIVLDDSLQKDQSKFTFICDVCYFGLHKICFSRG